MSWPHFFDSQKISANPLIFKMLHPCNTSIRKLKPDEYTSIEAMDTYS